MLQRAMRRRCPFRRVALAVVLASLSLAVSSPATASTIGILAADPAYCTTGLADRLPLSEAAVYTVPGGPGLSAWTVTSWSHNAPSSPAPSPLIMKIYRHLSSSFWQVVALDGPRPLAGGQLNTFPVSLPVRTGDLLGLNTSGQNGCTDSNSALFQSHLVRPGSLAVDTSSSFESTEPGRLNVSAEVVPDNSFTLGKAKINAKKGAATLLVDIPNFGVLIASGKGVKRATAQSDPGTAKLRIKAKGKQRRKLDETGRVSLSLKITYTPGQGNPNTQSKKLTLRKHPH